MAAKSRKYIELKKPALVISIRYGSVPSEPTIDFNYVRVQKTTRPKGITNQLAVRLLPIKLMKSLQFPDARYRYSNFHAGYSISERALQRSVTKAFSRGHAIQHALIVRVSADRLFGRGADKVMRSSRIFCNHSAQNWLKRNCSRKVS